MNKVNIFTIKSKLTIIAFGIAFIWIIVGIIIYNYINLINQYENLTTSVNEFSVNIIQLRKAENNFLLIEQLNPYFYNTGKSKYLDNFYTQHRRSKANIEELYKNQITKDPRFNLKLEMINKNLNLYFETFEELHKNIRERGYLEYGQIGELNTSIQNIENTISKFHENNFLNEKILILRKYEKDFLSLKDLTFSEYLLSTIETYKKFFRDVRTTLSPEEVNNLVNELDDYKLKFEKVVQKEIKIGLTPVEGLTGQTQRIIDKIEKDVEVLMSDIKQTNKKALDSTKYSLFVTIIILGFIIILLLFITLFSITEPLSKIKAYIGELVLGKFPETIRLKNKDEVAEMVDALNSFVNNLKSKAIFSEQIGKGQLDAGFVPVSQYDTLGNSLLQMRDSLKQASEEDIKRKIEDSKLNWATQGIARFNDILRQYSGNIDTLTYKIISNLVEYLDVNQGGLFIINDDEQYNVYLELVAAYAYNQEKKLKRKIYLKEGIVGTCAVEKTTAYIKDIPDDYMLVTSGLGKANPKFLLVVPLVLNEIVFGIIELASFNEVEMYKIQFVERLTENIAATLSIVKTNDKTQKLLVKFQQQSEDLASKEEEMRQNLEELQATQENMALQQEDIKALRTVLDRAIIEGEYASDGRIVRVNKKYCEITGFSENELIETNVFDYLVGIEKNRLKEVWYALLAGKPFAGILKGVHKNGNDIWFHANYIPIKNFEGNITKIFYIAQDITELKTLELEYYEREARLELKIKKLESELKEYRNKEIE